MRVLTPKHHLNLNKPCAIPDVWLQQCGNVDIFLYGAGLLLVATVHFEQNFEQNFRQKETWVRASVRLPTVNRDLNRYDPKKGTFYVATKRSTDTTLRTSARTSHVLWS